MIRVCKKITWPIFSFFIILVFATSTSVSAAPVEKSDQKEFQQENGPTTARLLVTLNNDKINVTESLQMTIAVTEPAGTSAILPDFSDLGFATDFNERSQRFRVTDISEITRTAQPDGSTVIEQKYTLEPWLSGDYAILPLLVTFKSSDPAPPNGENADATKATWQAPLFSLMTDGIRVNVSPLPAERQELSDLFGQADLNEDSLSQKERRTENKSDEEIKRQEEDKKEAILALDEKKFPWWIVWTILAIISLGPLFWFFGRKRIKQIFMPKQPPAHKIALEALARLQEKKLPEQGMLKEYYYQLSYILRKFIGGRFKIYADKQTTEEFFQQLLINNPFDKMSEQTLKEFSELADTVKYSLYRPDSTVAQESYQIARSFIEQNKPKEEGDK